LNLVFLMRGMGFLVRTSLLYSFGLEGGSALDALDERKGLLPLVLMPSTGEEVEEENLLNRPDRRGRFPARCKGRKSNPTVVPMRRYFPSRTAPQSGCPCFETGKVGDRGLRESPILSSEGGAFGISAEESVAARRALEVLDRDKRAVGVGERTPLSEEGRSAPLNCLSIREALEFEVVPALLVAVLAEDAGCKSEKALPLFCDPKTPS
jgi:hypothetical protein